ncbi:MAG: nucleoside triphosphate pyrophosphohydrolase [Verrucomicrobiae bacterium]|nr:nucleoside triphosphate pyrophosphohydrolase [Verrucomicrobiae bacterium]
MPRKKPPVSAAGRPRSGKLPKKTGSLPRLLEIMAILRSPEGCPWDREQDHHSIRQCLIEEAYEVLEAIEASDDPALCEELGDLLLQVVFHAQLASERGAFDFDAVADRICRKLIERHPHVFGTGKLANADAVLAQWEQIKSGERSRAGKPSGALEGIPAALPALVRAEKLQKRAAKAGFTDAELAGAWNRAGAEWKELEGEMGSKPNAARAGEEIGDMMFALANVARHLKLEPEQLLRATNAKFEKRFRRMESELARSGKKIAGTPLPELERRFRAARG